MANCWQNAEDGEGESEEWRDSAEAASNRRRNAVTRLPLPFTSHARCRAARRNVVPNAIEYVLAYGRMVHRTGITFYFLARRDIPPVDRRAAWAARLEGTVVLVASNGEIITVYRNRNALRPIRRKMKYRLALPDEAPMDGSAYDSVTAIIAEAV